jgi:hypothetical protein
MGAVMGFETTLRKLRLSPSVALVAPIPDGVAREVLISMRS